ncbi:MAG TPA: GGDEF domain-containing protein, partial [Nocardioidaceae bacterium]|nr:GGDEF domain-containing protein [Nocardioidaceae bacterium]
YRSAYHDLVHSIAALEEFLASHPVSALDETVAGHLGFTLRGVSQSLEELHLYHQAVSWTDRLGDILERFPSLPHAIATSTRRADAMWELACSERVRGDDRAACIRFDEARTAYLDAAARVSETATGAARTQELAAIACACDVMTGRHQPDSRAVIDEALWLQRRAPHGYGRHLRLAAAILAQEQGRADDAATAIARAADRVDWDGLGATDLVILIEHARITAPDAMNTETPTGTLVRRLVGDWHRRAAADLQAYEELLASERARVRGHSRISPLHVDSLTGVGNRRAIDAGLSTLLTRARSGVSGLSVAFIDVDDFTAINGEHGHLAGDTVLRRVATALRTACTDDAVIARFGGDEFVVLAPDHTPDQLEARLAPLTRMAPVDESEAGADVAISLTIGISPAKPTSTVTDVLAAADLAMIDGKRAGKARVVVVE